MKYKLQYLEWHDAFSNSAWHNEGELKEFMEGEFIIKQVGWVIEETDKQLILAGRIAPADNLEPQQYGQLEKIPKTWIRKRINLTKYIK